MRLRITSLILLPIVALAAFSGLQGQNTAPPPLPQPAPIQPQPMIEPPAPALFTPPVLQPIPGQPPQVEGEAKATEGGPLAMDGLNELQKKFVQSTRRGSDWLWRMNTNTGRFKYGWHADLAVEIEGNSDLPQAHAAYGLARAARLTGEERYIARAYQAILALLDATTVENELRRPTLPSLIDNQVGVAGLVVLAISELPDPAARELLQRSEQLCAFLRSRVRPDGSVRCSDAANASVDSPEEINGANNYAGIALYALARSQRRHPAAWKTEVVARAAAFYMPRWRAARKMEFVSWHSAAYAEAFLITRDRKLADAVLEMNDWLVGFQYDSISDANRLNWNGGFAGLEKDHRVETPPDAGTATSAESLAQACRVTRQLGDVDRHQRYTAALENALRFLTDLQYSDSSTQHFAVSYRPCLVGGFYVSHQDGTLKIENTLHALAALSLYLEHVAR